jgi:hypothetical protein
VSNFNIRLLDPKQLALRPLSYCATADCDQALLGTIRNRKLYSVKRKVRTPQAWVLARDRREAKRRDKFAAEIRRRYPGLPLGEEHDIADRACAVGSGRVGRSTVAEDPVRLAVVAHARHGYTDYDDILDSVKDQVHDRESREWARADARRKIIPALDGVLRQWETPARKAWIAPDAPPIPAPSVAVMPSVARPLNVIPNAVAARLGMD